MTKIFEKEHPEYVRIASHIHRARAERALYLGEAIGNGLMAVVHVARGWRALFAPRSRKAA